MYLKITWFIRISIKDIPFISLAATIKLESTGLKWQLLNAPPISWIEADRWDDDDDEDDESESDMLNDLDLNVVEARSIGSDTEQRKSYKDNWPDSHAVANIHDCFGCTLMHNTEFSCKNISQISCLY